MNLFLSMKKPVQFRCPDKILLLKIKIDGKLKFT